MDQRPRQSGAGRSDRNRQKLVGLGARPTRPAATTDRSSTNGSPACSRTSRWRAAMDAIRACCAISAAPISHSRRLGPGAPRRRRPARSPGNPRRTLRPPLHDDHLPTSRRSLARNHRRPDLCRRDPGSPRSQRPPHRTGRRKHASDPRKAKPEGLTEHHQPVTKIHRPARLAPGRHHSVTVGGIIQESRAALSRYTRAASSESAL